MTFLKLVKFFLHCLYQTVILESFINILLVPIERLVQCFLCVLVQLWFSSIHLDFLWSILRIFLLTPPFIWNNFWLFDSRLILGFLLFGNFHISRLLWFFNVTGLVIRFLMFRISLDVQVDFFNTCINVFLDHGISIIKYYMNYFFNAHDSFVINS